MHLGIKIFNKKDIGNIGENFASKHLRKNGYKIIERNYKIKSSEIDIICSKGNELIFVEVKTRSNNKYGTPAEAVDYYKRKKILNGAKFYLMQKNITDTFIRFDVIEVFMDNKYKPININHILNAFGG